MADVLFGLWVGAPAAMGLVWVILCVAGPFERDADQLTTKSGAEDILHIQEKAIQKIGQTADYWAELFDHMAYRMEEEARRGQSGLPSTSLGNGASGPVVASGEKEPQYAGVSVKEEHHNGIPTFHLARLRWLLNAR